MGRRREDEEDVDDDRPARRPQKPGGGGKRTLVILGFSGAMVLVILAGCALSGWFLLKPKFVSPHEETAQTFAQSEADKFLEALTYNAGTMTYESMSPAYQSATSYARFQELVARNPLLTGHKTTRVLSADAPTGTKPNRKMVVGYELVGFTGTPDLPDATKRTKSSAKTLAVTITVAEQPDGKWKVDGLSVP